MTTKTATTKAAESTDDFVKEALKFYEEALKSGIQLQEESIKLWKDILAQVGKPEDLKKKLEEMAHDVLPKSQARIDEVVSLFQENAKQCTDLFSKTISLYQVSTVAESQRRFQDLIETSLTALHKNVHTVVDTNAQLMKAWDDVFARK